MTEGSQGRATEGTPEPISGRKDWLELRDLLLGPERFQLSDLQSRLDDRSRRAADISEVLPEALALRGPEDPKLTAVLAPSVERAIEISVKRDPRPLVRALFPLIGPAIRKSIAFALTSKLASLQESLERGFSLEGLKWRVEAFRSGRSFTEIVLLHTLVYRVEQVLLIHERTGLVLEHVVAPSVQPEDAALVSGMLSAIRDFVRDSFHVPQSESVETMKVGELTLWIETGPLAYMVGVIQGSGPPKLRAVLQETLEAIHKDYSSALENFDGDDRGFASVRPMLESCLTANYADPPTRSLRRAWVVIPLVLVMFTAAAIFVRNQLRWSAYLDRLNKESGIVVLDAGTGVTRFHVAGLRDPLAVDPDALLSQSGFRPERVVSRWRPYQSAEPSLVLLRARALLKPPDGVALEFNGGRLRLSGPAPHDWIANTRMIAGLIPGVTHCDDSQLVDVDRQDLQNLADGIESLSVLFDLDSSALRSAAQAETAVVASRLKQILDRARVIDTNVRVDIVGHTDKSGAEKLNLNLGLERAYSVGKALDSHGVETKKFERKSVGSNKPNLAVQSPNASQDRRVTFELDLMAGADVKAARK